MTIGDSQTRYPPSDVSWRHMVSRRQPDWLWAGSVTDGLGFRTDGRSGSQIQTHLDILASTEIPAVVAQIGTPTDITIMLGGNDINAGVSDSVFATRYSSLISQLKIPFPDARIWAFTICPFAALQAEMDLQRAKIMDGTSIPGIDYVIDLATLTYPTNAFLGDNLHLSPTGAMFVGDIISNAMASV